ncbi:hypothetical protein ABZ929_26125 [Streptomyces physcomitrii]|uniref:hypothetical protein n=1 Tax=Streptomyces physcomitrii TaxID=2724184 RepID=UPI0034266C5C
MGQIQRVRVANDLDILVRDNSYFGWLPQNPASHLSRHLEIPPQDSAPIGLRIALKDYLRIFSEHNLDKIADGDEALLSQADDLLTRIDDLPKESRQQAIHDQVKDLLEWFR